jgi:signal transduction histidine kinase
MSITKRILLHVGLGAALVLAVVAIVTYRTVFSATEKRVVAQLDTYVTERTRREEASFKVVYANLATARSLFLGEIAKPIPQDIDAQWKAAIQQDPDGAWRSPRRLGRPSFWGRPDFQRTPAMQQRTLAALRVLRQLEPGWKAAFPSVFFNFPACSLGFNPEQPNWSWDVKPDFAIEKEDWYYPVTPEHDPAREFHWTPLCPDPITKISAATLLAPIWQGDEWIGMVGHDYDATRLINEVVHSELPGATHLIVRGDGRLMAYEPLQPAITKSEGELTVTQAGDLALANLHAIVMQSGRESSSGVEPLGRNYYSASRLRLPGADWYFITTMPQAFVRAQAFASARWVLWSGVASLALLLAVFGGILRRLVSRPLHALTHATDALSAGTADIPLPPVRKDELGALAKSFGVMVEKVAAREGDLRALNLGMERRVAERTEDLNQALAREKELSELKSSFVSMVSHEFRTPLGVIVSAADVLQRYYDRLTPEKRESQLEMIFRSTKNLAALIDEVLLLGRVEEGRMKFAPAPMELDKFCRSLCDEVYSATGGVCQIRMEVEGALSGAIADEALLRHVLSNLLSNACKYSDPGQVVDFDCRREGESAIFVVRDHGIGIPEADQAQLLTSFTRASNVGSRPGTGLGLVVVQRCVKLHGGELVMESTVGVGTTVTVTLPLFVVPPLGGSETVRPPEGGTTNAT